VNGDTDCAYEDVDGWRIEGGLLLLLTPVRQSTPNDDGLGVTKIISPHGFTSVEVVNSSHRGPGAKP